jgi:hypothetical protein
MGLYPLRISLIGVKTVFFVFRLISFERVWGLPLQGENGRLGLKSERKQGLFERKRRLFERQ